MHLTTVAILAATGFITTTSAAECYAQGGSNRCSTAADVRGAHEDFCNNHWTGDSASVRYTSSNGFHSNFAHFGAFHTQQDCWDSTEDIIDQCIGHKNGGTWTVPDFLVNINFCVDD
ncbi:hypothetical protein L218DRAFT_863944 [Marasmius fiardii PR-910]|nr:hypothetical protein L218DRAFT_863944 [Marasmius fiardii PR-910]